MTQPTIPDSDRIVTYSPVNSVGPFPVPFPLFDASGADLAVELDGVKQAGNWSISVGMEPGFWGAPNTYTNGSITFTAPITGSLEIRGDRAPRRQNQYAEGRGVPARDQNTDLNTLTAVTRELWYRLRQVDTIGGRIFSRLVRAPWGESLIELPPAKARADKQLWFDGLGNPVTTRQSIAVIGGVALLSTRTAVASAVIPSGADFISTMGYGATGDGGGALYVKVGSQPTHAGKVQSADGAWWELAEREPRPEAFGARGDGATNDLAALTDWLAYHQAKGYRKATLGPRTYRQGGLLSLFTGLRLYGGGGVILKGYDGILFNAGDATEMHGVVIDGNSAQFSGNSPLVMVDTGNDQKFSNCQMTQAAGRCVEYAPDKGIRSQVIGGVYASTRLSGAFAAIYWPDDANNGDRTITNVDSAGTALVDMGCQNGGVLNCDTYAVYFRASAKKVRLIGNRIANAALFPGSAPINVLGTSHTIVGNIISGDFFLGAGCNETQCRANVVAGAIADLSGSATNRIEYEQSFTPTITGPVLGSNANLSGRLIRRDKVVRLIISINLGTTGFAAGSGPYSIGVPGSLAFNNGGLAVGSARLFIAGVSVHGGACYMQAGTPAIRCTFTGGSDWGPAQPSAVAAGSSILVDISYEMG